MNDRDYDFFDDELHDEKKCKYCNGNGYLTAEPDSSLAYHCPDCTETED